MLPAKLYKISHSVWLTNRALRCILSISMKRWGRVEVGKIAGAEEGFTIVEALVATAIFGILVATLITSLNSLRFSYTLARQYNEIYTVLSACPEIDRALQYNSVSSTTNCYPNNSFPAEDGQGGTITYAPSVTVSDTSALPSNDPLQSVYDSKVLNISVGFPRPNTAVKPLQLRMLITRNGIGQQ